MVERVVAAVQAKWQKTGRGAEFELLKTSLLGEGPPGGYAAAARTLGTSEGAVKVAVHRLRKAFRKLEWQNALIVDGAELDANFALAARNIPEIDVLPVQGINVVDILRRHKLVLTKAALEALEARFA